MKFTESPKYMMRNEVRRYRIRVEGVLDPLRWSPWFDGLEMRNETGSDADLQAETIIEGELPDQCALHGVLTKVRDLHLTLISVERLPASGNGVQPFSR